MRMDRPPIGEGAGAEDLRRQAEALARRDQPIEAAAFFRAASDDDAALSTLIAIPADAAEYRAAARTAIDIALRKRAFPFALEDWLRPYLAEAPREPSDVEALFRLGRLYELLSFHELARGIYARILDVDPEHPARGRLRELEAYTAGNPTEEIRMSSVDRKRIRALLKGGDASEGPPSFGEIGVGAVMGRRYELTAEIGKGSTATVFAARDLVEERTVAIKVFTLAGADPTLLERFKRELDLAHRLIHPHIAALYDIDLRGDYPFIAMELLVGTNLDSVVEEGPLPLDRATGILMQAASGLGYAHQQGVIHRDIKSENLFLTDHGEIKLMDFGMAKAKDDRSLTGHGFTGGTPYYISPEQISDFKTVDHRTDLYALGVVAYELYTGRLPFECENLVDLLRHHLEVPPPDPREKNPDLPLPIAEMILRLLEKDPLARLSSCEELQAHLERFEAG